MICSGWRLCPVRAVPSSHRPAIRPCRIWTPDATEIDMFSGALIRMGRELGIPTPYNEFSYHMIKALEEKNDGRFDYSGPDQEMTWAR